MGISFKLLFQRINYCNFSSFETQASTSKQMKSLLLVLAVLPLHSWMLNGRYLLVDITETVGYSFEYNFRCFGKTIQFGFRDFQDAKRECDSNRECGCIDTAAHSDCATATPEFFTIHYSFRIQSSAGTCGWVKS